MQRIAMNQQPQRVSHYHAAQMMNSNNGQGLMHGSTSTDQLLNELSWIIQTASGAAPQSLPPPPFIYTLPPQQQQPPHMYHVNQNRVQYHTGNVENRSGEGSIWSTPLCSPLPQMQPVSVASFPFPPPPHHHHYASSSSNNNSLLCSPSSNSSNFSPSPCSPPPMSARLFCGESNNTNSNVHHSNQSTPRPIRKALFVTGAATATATATTQPNLNQSTSSNNTQTSNKMADGETMATMTVAKNGSELHARSNVENSNSSNEQRAKQGQQQRGGNNRSSRGPASGSPPSAPRHRHQQQQQQKQSRQLPIRSKNIDLSQYLANLSLNNNNMPNDSSTSKAASTIGSNTSSGDMKCAFCENNRESREVYTSHNLKDSLGKIVCPILRNFVCPKCGESGDYAHTDKYCPVTQRKHKENKIRKFFSSTANSTSSVAATSSFQH